MKLRIATIDFLRGDVGNALFKDLGMPLFEQHYSHHTATEPTFKRFTERITRQVHFISDGQQLRKPTIFPQQKEVIEGGLDDTLGSSQRLAEVFKARAEKYEDEILWGHWFAHTHKAPVLDNYHARASEVVSIIKQLIVDLGGNWIVSADHGICWDDPQRRIDRQTLHVPLASNWLRPINGRTNHDGLADAINSGDRELYTWNTLQCHDDWPGGKVGGLGNKYHMTPDGALRPMERVRSATEEEIKAQMEKLGYL